MSKQDRTVENLTNRVNRDKFTVESYTLGDTNIMAIHASPTTPARNLTSAFIGPRGGITVTWHEMGKGMRRETGRDAAIRWNVMVG